MHRCMCKCVWREYSMFSDRAHSLLLMQKWIRWKPTYFMQLSSNRWVYALTKINENKHFFPTFSVKLTDNAKYEDPCSSSPCGLNAECRANDTTYTCNCLPDFIGSPPNCKPACKQNADCASELACINQHCENPCVKSTCGLNTECYVENHGTFCKCIKNFFGNPLVECSLKAPTPINPCESNPCGGNATCLQQNGVAICQCLPDYTGNPYEGCKPECSFNSDCRSNRSCIRNKCQDPCLGACSPNEKCQVTDHTPYCFLDPITNRKSTVKLKFFNSST